MVKRPYFKEMLPELLPVSEEEIDAVANTFRSVPLTTLFGDYEIAAFERDFAHLFGSPYAVAVTSGTSALHAALAAAEIGVGDEVIVTPFSFIASVSVILQVGATPVFADIDPETFVLAIEDVARKLTSRTRAILPVHACGYPVDMVALGKLAEDANAIIIEDCAAAHGATVAGQAVGTFGDFGCFSFNISKIMRVGEGGMVLTRSEEMDQRLRSIRVNGLIPTPEGTWVKHLGFNYTMMQAIGALGRVQVRNFEALSTRRRQIGERIREGILGLPVKLPPDRPGLQRAYYSMPFLLPEELTGHREEIVAALRSHNVPFSKGNRQLLHEVDYIKKNNPTASCLVAEGIHPRLFFLDPLPSYDDEQVEGIISVLKIVLNHYAQIDSPRIAIKQKVTERQLGVGIIGAGRVAQWHAQALKQLPNVRLEAITDIDPRRAKEFTIQHNIKQSSTTLKELLECDAVEAVFICTPPATHASLAKVALAAGKQVFIEKPLTTTLSDALDLVKIVEQTGRVLQVGQITRFDKELRCLREIIKTGVIGRLVRARAVSVASFLPSGWYADVAYAGGGVLMDIGVHAIDALLYVMDDPALCNTQAWKSTAFGSYNVEDNVLAILEFAGGVSTSLEASYGVAPMAGGTSATIELFGTHGYARTRPFAVRTSDGKVKNRFAHIEERVGGVSPYNTAGLFLEQDAHFIECCLNGTPSITDVQVGAEIVRIVNEIYRAADLICCR